MPHLLDIFLRVSLGFQNVDFVMEPIIDALFFLNIQWSF